ncbi:hypothetical protein ACG9XS_08635 [Acinetobacter gyllenbergii]|uniref:hypothetical protein n=1 Tax=Acinetobacter gyllenbergii TaxID=134534 RepID=UPI003AF90123
MTDLRIGDVVKHSSYPFSFKVIKVSNQWITCEGMSEIGQRVVEDFSPLFLEVVSRRPKMKINMADIEQAFSK